MGRNKASKEEKEKKESLSVEEQLILVDSEDTTKGERYYANKFKSVYQRVRKSLVILNKNRKELTNETVVEKTKEILTKALESLD